MNKKAITGQQKKINLGKELRKLCERNRDGSFATQAARRHILTMCAEQLKEAGFYNLAPSGLKQKHVKTLVDKWLAEEKTPGAIKNRMAQLRWWAEKIGKPNVIARDNSIYGIPERTYVTNQSKASTLESEKLAKINDNWIRCSLELQKAFGLRREECLKFQPQYADLGDRIRLKDSWTKGGKAREIPLRNDYQRSILNKAHAIAKNGSMIPPEKSYVEQLRLYEGLTKYAGLSKMHGLRHAYAQERYKELTGRDCPAQKGKISQELTKDEKTQDLATRLQISKELGHEREEVTAVYLGR